MFGLVSPSGMFASVSFVSLTLGFSCKSISTHSLPSFTCLTHLIFHTFSLLHLLFYPSFTCLGFHPSLLWTSCLLFVPSFHLIFELSAHTSCGCRATENVACFLWACCPSVLSTAGVHGLSTTFHPTSFQAHNITQFSSRFSPNASTASGEQLHNFNILLFKLTTYTGSTTA